jgi:hypothetical protein
MKDFRFPSADNLAWNLTIFMDLFRIVLVAGKQLTTLNHGRYGKHS